MIDLRTKLSYTLYILLVAFLMVGCTKGNELQNRNSFKDYDVIEIEGCEYINWGMSYGYMNITHKGNCKNH
jgi:hypothetical protein